MVSRVPHGGPAGHAHVSSYSRSSDSSKSSDSEEYSFSCDISSQSKRPERLEQLQMKAKVEFKDLARLHDDAIRDSYDRAAWRKIKRTTLNHPNQSLLFKTWRVYNEEIHKVLREQELTGRVLYVGVPCSRGCFYDFVAKNDGRIEELARHFETEHPLYIMDQDGKIEEKKCSLQLTKALDVPLSSSEQDRPYASCDLFSQSDMPQKLRKHRALAVQECKELRKNYDDTIRNEHKRREWRKIKNVTLRHPLRQIYMKNWKIYKSLAGRVVSEDRSKRGLLYSGLVCTKACFYSHAAKHGCNIQELRKHFDMEHTLYTCDEEGNRREEKCIISIPDNKEQTLERDSRKYSSSFDNVAQQAQVARQRELRGSPREDTKMHSNSDKSNKPDTEESNRPPDLASKSNVDIHQMRRGSVNPTSKPAAATRMIADMRRNAVSSTNTPPTREKDPKAVPLDQTVTSTTEFHRRAGTPTHSSS